MEGELFTYLYGELGTKLYNYSILLYVSLSFLIRLFRSQIRFNTVAAAIETIDDSDGFFTKDSDSQDKVANGTRKLSP